MSAATNGGAAVPDGAGVAAAAVDVVDDALFVEELHAVNITIAIAATRVIQTAGRAVDGACMAHRLDRRNVYAMTPVPGPGREIRVH
jgi:hypothetical protein